MTITYESHPIRCGNHELKPHVTFTQYERERTIDGHTIRFAGPPDIIVRCETCGREAHTNQFILDKTFTERTWPQ